MDWRTLFIRQHRVLFVFAFLALVVLKAAAATCFGAADSVPAGNTEQIEITVLHVDQYAVYGPNRIFYFDTNMDKRKNASMMKAADHLRNRKAIITYSSPKGPQDKHVFLMDISPAGEKTTAEKLSPPTREARETVTEQQNIVGKASSAEAVSAPPAVPAETRDAAGLTRFQEKTPPPQPRMEAQTPANLPQEKPARAASSAGIAPPVNDPVEPRVSASSRPTAPREKAQLPGQRVEASAPANTNIERIPSRTADSPHPITKQEITSFVRNILDLNGKKDLSGVLPFYADKVDYYDRGVVGRDYVKRDLGYYFHNWDSITTTLDGDVVMIVLDQPEERTAKFISRFSVRNEKKSVTGRTENIWRIQRINGRLRLVGVKQRVLSRDQ